MIARFDGASSEFRLLHQVMNLEEAPIPAGNRLRVEHAIGGDGLTFHHLGRQHRGTGFVVDIDHLLKAGDWSVDDVVGQHHGEGFVAHQLLGISTACPRPSASFCRT